MRETAGCIEVFHITGHCVSIGQDLVHATLLIAHHGLHLLLREARCQADGPIRECQKHLLRILISAIHPCITQTCIHLVKIIEWRPSTVIHSEFTRLERRPEPITTRETSDIIHSPFRMILRMSSVDRLKFAEHIFHPFAAFLIGSSSIVHSHCRKVMTGDMPVQTVPVGIWIGFHIQSCFFSVRSKQTVHIIFHENLQIQITGRLQRTFQQFHIPKREGIRVKSVLSRDTCRRDQKRQSEK